MFVSVAVVLPETFVNLAVQVQVNFITVGSIRHQHTPVNAI